MHVLFVHQNFPAQFGHIARKLVQDYGWQCTCVTRNPAGTSDGVTLIPYELKGGATEKTHYCTRSFENAVVHCQGVFEACRQHREIQPDLIVGHSGFGSTLFLRELYDCPIVNYFEYFYRPHGSDMDFRPEFPSKDIDFLRSYCRNAMILLDLEYCRAGYAPTHWQKSLLPTRYADKVQVIHDGVDTELWRRHDGLSRQIGPHSIDAGTRIVTYVARGLESMRGFDIFMKLAKRIYQQMPNVLFVVVGADQVFYGGDLNYVKEKSFREHVLKQDDYNLSKFLFTGTVPPAQLAKLLSLSDLHVYLTVPFVLSWSLLDALACGCTVVASNTEPVREVITHDQNGLLADFYDLDRLTELSLQVLRDPKVYYSLGQAGTAMVQDKYTLRRTLLTMVDFFQSVASRAQ
jgi:glycosyltransferase involved in cell wall biosynthesis